MIIIYTSIWWQVFYYPISFFLSMKISSHLIIQNYYSIFWLIINKSKPDSSSESDTKLHASDNLMPSPAFFHKFIDEKRDNYQNYIIFIFTHFVMALMEQIFRSLTHICIFILFCIYFPQSGASMQHC